MLRKFPSCIGAPVAKRGANSFAAVSTSAEWHRHNQWAPAISDLSLFLSRSQGSNPLKIADLFEISSQIIWRPFVWEIIDDQKRTAMKGFSKKNYCPTGVKVISEKQHCSPL